MFPESLYFWEAQSHVITEATFPSSLLCNYVYTSASDCKAVGNVLESILWKPFQLFRHILNYVSSITTAPSLQCWFQSRVQVAVSWSQGRRVWGDAPVLSPCSLLSNPWQKPTVVLEHCCEGRNQLLVFYFSGRFVLIASFRGRRMSICISLFTVAIPVNYSRESYVYWIVRHLDSWIKIDQLDVTCFIISLFTYCSTCFEC